jgi:hypothetical protein
MLHSAGAIGSPTMAAMRFKYGPRWAHYWRDQIMTFPVELTPEDGPAPPFPVGMG